MSIDTTAGETASGEAPAAGPDPHVNVGSRLPFGLALAIVVVAGALARFWAIDFGLPHTQARPDETFIIDVALSFLRGNFWPRFYDYPRLYAYLVTLLYLGYFAVGWLAGRFATLSDLVASWPVYWQPFFLISRSLAAVAGTLTILVVYDMARRLAGRAAGLVAALFISLAYLHVRDSHFGTTDTLMTLLAVASVRWLLRSDLSRAGRADLLSAVSAGLATATKYNAVFSLVPIGLSQVLHATAQPARRLRSLVDSRGLWLVLAFGLAFLVGVPFLLFDYPHFSQAMQALSRSLGRSQGPAIASNGWWYHLATLLRYGLGLPLLVAGLAGIGVLARRDWRTALLLFSFPLTSFAAAGASRLLFPRYVTPAVPFLCVGAAIAVVSVGEAVARHRPALRTWVMSALALVLVAPSAWRVVTFDYLMGQTDNRVLVSDWMVRHSTAGATIAQSGTRFGHAQFERRTGLKVWLWDKEHRNFAWDGRGVTERPDWILLQESPLPSSTQSVELEYLRNDYQLAATFQAFDPEVRGNVYNSQDAFFLPFAGFRGVTRPGPNFLIYKRSDVRVLQPGADR